MSAKVIILLILAFFAGGVAGGTYFYMESKPKYAELPNEEVVIPDILIQPGDDPAPAKN